MERGLGLGARGRNQIDRKPVANAKDLTLCFQGFVRFCHGLLELGLSEIEADKRLIVSHKKQTVRQGGKRPHRRRKNLSAGDDFKGVW